MYELTYTGFDGLVNEIVIDCDAPINDGAFLHFALDDGTSVALMANSRVLEVRNLDEAERITFVSKEEHEMGTTDGGKFGKPGWMR